MLSGSWWDEDGFWYGLHTLLDPVRVPYFRSVLKTHLATSRRPLVLDIGSGGGFVASGVSDIARVVAIDRSLESLRDARVAGVGMVVVADASQLPFRRDGFEAVICSEVLEHVVDPPAVVAEAARVTKHEGLFAFSTPSRTSVSRLVLINVAQKWRWTRVLPVDLDDWKRFLTSHELGSMLARSGLTVLEIRGVGIKAAHVPSAVLALGLLRLRRIGYAEAGRRIDLTTTKRPTFAMIGFAFLAAPGSGQTVGIGHPIDEG